jgi:thioredoxin 1
LIIAGILRMVGTVLDEHNSSTTSRNRTMIHVIISNLRMLIVRILHVGMRNLGMFIVKISHVKMFNITLFNIRIIHVRTLTIMLITITCLAAASAWAQEKTDKPLVTFVELGSVKCIPCRQMQPVMKAIEAKYGGQVKVLFYDVWKSDQRDYAEKYGIKLIPTQVFLDKEGKEFFRHEGFYPVTEIDTLLQKRGLVTRNGE